VAVRHLSFPSFASSHRGSLLPVTGTVFALGLLMGTAIHSSWLSLSAAKTAPPLVGAQEKAATATPSPARFDSNVSYPAEVARIIDGDTFEARVRVWPGIDIDTKVRLRGIDAAELHARCGEELAKAEAARTALQTILAQGDVRLSQIGIDKYGGRVDAAVATRTTADVSTALLNGGFARAYGGGKRSTWCG
jgi:endonuclease YncB( thermonuclease family)